MESHCAGLVSPPPATLRAAFSALVLGVAANVHDAVCRDRSTAPLLKEMSLKLCRFCRTDRRGFVSPSPPYSAPLISSARA